MLQCFVDNVMKPEIKDLRACPEVGGTVMFPPDSKPYPFGVDPYWHGTKVGPIGLVGWRLYAVIELAWQKFL